MMPAIAVPCHGSAGSRIGGVGVDAVAVVSSVRVADEIVAGIHVEVAQQIRVRDIAGIEHRDHHGLGLAQRTRGQRLPHLRHPDLPQRPLAGVRVAAAARLSGFCSGGVARIVGNRRTARAALTTCASADAISEAPAAPPVRTRTVKHMASRREWARRPKGPRSTDAGAGTARRRETPPRRRPRHRCPPSTPRAADWRIRRAARNDAPTASPSAGSAHEASNAAMAAT